MFFNSVDGVGKSGKVFLFQVPSLALTSCKSLLLLVQMTLREEERRKGTNRKKCHGKVAHRNTLHFHCETFSFPYYLSSRNCLFQFCYVDMFISETSVDSSH